jgi:glucosyl-dolichyl phosphate glucuronosyltransferase
VTSVSIIICTRNRAALLRPTLESLRRLEIPRDYSAELIAVDNASTDETARLIQTSYLPNLRVRYLYEGTSGKSYGVNSALRAAHGEIILCTDDDVRVRNDWIEAMCKPIVKGEADLVGGEVRIAEHLRRDWMTQTHLNWLADTTGLPEMNRLPFGANMGFHRRVLSAVPYLDTELGPEKFNADDILFCLQVREMGFRIVIVPSVVEHHLDASRLLYKYWQRRAWMEGHAEAFLAYHWFRRQVRFTALRGLYKKLQLSWYRFSRGRKCNDQEGCSAAELHLMKYVEFFRAYAEEQRKPRKYQRKGPDDRLRVPPPVCATP